MIRLWVKFVFLEKFSLILYLCSLDHIRTVHLADSFVAIEATTLLTLVNRCYYTLSEDLVQ